MFGVPYEYLIGFVVILVIFLVIYQKRMKNYESGYNRIREWYQSNKNDLPALYQKRIDAHLNRIEKLIDAQSKDEDRSRFNEIIDKLNKIEAIKAAASARMRFDTEHDATGLIESKRYDKPLRRKKTVYSLPGDKEVFLLERVKEGVHICEDFHGNMELLLDEECRSVHRGGEWPLVAMATGVPGDQALITWPIEGVMKNKNRSVIVMGITVDEQYITKDHSPRPKLIPVADVTLLSDYVASEDKDKSEKLTDAFRQYREGCYSEEAYEEAVVSILKEHMDTHK